MALFKKYKSLTSENKSKIFWLEVIAMSAGYAADVTVGANYFLMAFIMLAAFLVGVNYFANSEVVSEGNWESVELEDAMVVNKRAIPDPLSVGFDPYRLYGSASDTLLIEDGYGVVTGPLKYVGID